jgi:hypothetical protein
MPAKKKAGAKKAGAKKAPAKAAPKKAAASKGAAKKTTAKSAAKPKAKTKPAKARKPAAARDVAAPENVAEAGPDSSGVTAAAKPGALARLKAGVGNLFAKVTGRSDKSGGMPPMPEGETGDTIELATGDILATREAPPRE